MTEFTENANLNKILEKVIGDKSLVELNALREQELNIAARLKVKTTKDGESQPCGGPPASVVKVSGLWAQFTDAKYVLVLDNYFFTHGDDKSIEGMVFDALQSIEIKVVKGEIKLAKRRPDIQVFSATVIHYGPVLKSLVELKAALAAGTKHFVSTVASGKLGDEPAEQQEETPEPAEEAPAPRRGGRR